jgi:type IX secretion system PorP/SprF family membrane protein
MSRGPNKRIEARKPASAKIVRIFALLISLSWHSLAQDIQFSQFYANILYLNPAFAGSANASRAIFHQRIQWPHLDAKYITSSFSLDHQFEKINSGVGLILLKDWQGANTISSTEAAMLYSYELSVSSKFSLRAGAKVNYVSRYINYNYLTLPDQYSNNGFSGVETQESFGNNKINYLDFSVGGVLYSDRFWLGIASDHLNRPNQSFSSGRDTSRLPIKMDFTTGTKIYIEKKRTTAFGEEGKEINLTPTVHYKFQGKSDQVDLGLYGLYDHIIFGFWYRGIPLLKQYRAGLQNNESMVFLTGWKIQRLLVSYSYDFTVSKLARANTGGSHELNITYVWEYPKKKKTKPMKRLPCPDFFD